MCSRPRRNRCAALVDRLYALGEWGPDPEQLSISVIHGFMAGDVPEMGTKVLVVTDDAVAKGDALAEKLGRELFDKSAAPLAGEADRAERAAVEARALATTAMARW